MQSNRGGVNLMKRQGDDFLDVDGVKERPRYLFSAVNSLRTNSQRLGSVLGLPYSTTSSNSLERKKRVTSGEFHLNYLGYDTTGDLSSNVLDSSKIRLDQDRPSDAIADPLRPTFPGQRGYVTDSRTI